MSTTTLPTPVEQDTTDTDDLVHRKCCIEMTTLCGLDMTGWEMAEGPPPPQRCCVVCEELDDHVVSNWTCPNADRRCPPSCPTT